MPALKYAAVILVVLALARPQWGTERTAVLTEGINIVLALDLSESMAALDFKKNGRVINRLEAVKGVVQDFVAGRSGDRIGMVVFGSHAYTQLPLTRDYNTMVSILDRLEIGPEIDAYLAIIDAREARILELINAESGLDQNVAGHEATLRGAVAAAGPILLRLVGLEPRPVSGRTVGRNEYRISLEVAPAS